MPNPTEVFVSALVEQFGEQAYPVVLEQVKRAMEDGLPDIAKIWIEIAGVVAARPKTIIPIWVAAGTQPSSQRE